MRTPGKLEPSLREKVRVTQGDAKDIEALKEAMNGAFFTVSFIWLATELGAQAKIRSSRLPYTVRILRGVHLILKLLCVRWSKPRSTMSQLVASFVSGYSRAR